MLDAGGAGRRLAGLPARRVLTIGQIVRGVGVDDQEGQARRGGIHRHRLEGEVPEVDGHGLTGQRAQGRRLVQPAGAGPGHPVLRGDADLGQAGAQGVVVRGAPAHRQARQAGGGAQRAGQLQQGQRGGRQQGRGGGKPAAHGHRRVDEQVRPEIRGQGQIRPALPVQGPGDAADVAEPPGDRARGDVRDPGFRGPGQLQGLGVQHAVGAQPGGDQRAVRQRGGQGAAAVEVHILAQQVQPPGGGPHAVRVLAVALPEGPGHRAHVLLVVRQLRPPGEDVLGGLGHRSGLISGSWGRGDAASGRRGPRRF
ncbi:Uncharacterised protein [Mycobacteroides abscessus subsp. abscessus]|nr:Uncharacterised protein [Mycobacteroides abscessus subsp. abscessus]